MNERIEDQAFAPVDKATPVVGRGPRPDGTVEYAIVEGDVYVNGVKQPKRNDQAETPEISG